MTENGKHQDWTLHAIGHGHIDPVWLWRWQEGYEEVRATFRAALDRMNETPDVTFIASSTAFYKWVLNNDPALFAEIQERVKEGRWHIVGGWVIEPDCNVPGGESFVRHVLYGQRFVREHFGFTVRHGFNPDTFGHPGTLPQILKKAGIETYSYMRPEPDKEMKYEASTFWWTARDGSRVLACCIPICYDTIDEHMDMRLEQILNQHYMVPGQIHTPFYYGIGNHGGGPTKVSIAKIQQWQNDPDKPTFIFSGLDPYFKALRENLPDDAFPVIENELQHHARGCYTTHSECKRLNRRTEHALMSAERWAAASMAAFDLAYPRERLQEAWETLLFQQFHDILAGTSIAEAYEDACDAFGAACHTADTIKNRCLQKLAGRIDTTTEGRSVVVFNPLPWNVRGPVELPFTVKRYLGPAVNVLDDSGRKQLAQEFPFGKVGTKGLTFLADVPGLGFRTYSVVTCEETAKPEKAANRGMLQAHRYGLENDWWRIQIDPASGEIGSLVDKKAGVDCLKRGLSLCVLADQSDTWSHDITAWRVEDGRFQLQDARVVDEGDCRITLMLETAFNRSTAQILLTLYREMPEIHVEIRLDWREKFRFLKLGFETRIADGEAVFDIPYGHIQREKSGDEEPGQSWIDLTGTVRTSEGGEVRYGLGLINDCKFGYDVRGETMRISLARGPVYAHHDPERVESGLPYKFIDQGWQTIRLRIVPHAGSWQDARLPHKAWELNEPLWPHQESAHAGELPQALSFINCSSDHFVLTVVKCAEDAGSLIVRGYESQGREGQVKLEFPHFKCSVEFSVAPHEIKTQKISPDGNWQTIQDTNLLEDEV